MSVSRNIRAFRMRLGELNSQEKVRNRELLALMFDLYEILAVMDAKEEAQNMMSAMFGGGAVKAVDREEWDEFRALKEKGEKGKKDDPGQYL